MRKLLLGCAALAFLVLGTPVAAQETRGSIEGTIKDSGGGVLPGVTVEAAIAGGTAITTVTDARGVYGSRPCPPAPIPSRRVSPASLKPGWKTFRSRSARS